MVNENLDALVVPDRRLTERPEEESTPQDTFAPLRETGRTRDHGVINCQWSCYEDIDSGKRFHVRRITVNPGAKLRAELHHHRGEHWVVVRGAGGDR